VAVRAVLMGTGFWAQNAHLPALRAQPDLTVAAIVGRTRERAQEFARATGIQRAFASLREAIEADRPDLVVVVAPDDVHPDACRAALEAGIPVFCEKPLANDASTAHELEDLATLAGVTATVGYSFRYSPAIQALRGDLVSGRLGSPWLIELFEYNAQFHPANRKPMNWKGDPAHAKAGALFEYGSHVVDLAGWLAGPVRAVSANLTRVLPGARLDDVATLQLRFEAPAIGVLVAGWVLAGSIPGIRIRLHGSEGLREVELNETLAEGQAYRLYRLDGSVSEEVPLEPLDDRRSAYARRHLKDFIARLCGEPPPFEATLPTFEDGARVQDVLEAALAGQEGWSSVAREPTAVEEDRK
jgi:predicted dehydrogenase